MQKLYFSHRVFDSLDIGFERMKTHSRVPKNGGVPSCRWSLRSSAKQSLIKGVETGVIYDH